MKRPPRDRPPPLPDVFAFDDAAALTRALVDAVGSVYGGKAALAAELGCKRNVVTNVHDARPNPGPTLQALLPAHPRLPERAQRYVALLMTASYAEVPEAREEAAALAAALRARVTRLRQEVRALRDSPAAAWRASETLRLFLGDPSYRRADLRHACWPPLAVAALRPARAEARRLGPATALRYPPAPPGDAPRLALELTLARLSLYALRVGDRLVRFMVWEIPEGEGLVAWAEEVDALLDDLARRAGAGARGCWVACQASPLTAPLGARSLRIWEGGPLRGGTVSSRKEDMTPPSLVSPCRPGEPPDIYAATSYAQFLRDYADFRKAAATAQGRTWTASRLYQGLMSAAQWSSIIRPRDDSGERRTLNADLAPRLAARMGLDSDRAACFALRVAHDNADDDAERARLRAQMIALPGYREARPVEVARFYALRSLLHLALYELAATPAFREDPGWIGAALRIDAAPDAVAQALADLELAGALRRDDGGRLRPSPDPAQLFGEEHRDLYHQLHLDLLDHVARSAAREPERCRVAGLAARVDPDDARACIDAFERRLAARLAALPPDAGPRAVYQLTVQLQPAGRLA